MCYLEGGHRLRRRRRGNLRLMQGGWCSLLSVSGCVGCCCQSRKGPGGQDGGVVNDCGGEHSGSVELGFFSWSVVEVKKKVNIFYRGISITDATGLYRV